MRFRKGSKVEVMNKDQVFTSWHVAEIVSGSGHTYNLKYECNPNVQKVSRKFIRPCPPPAQGLESLVTGDKVEVLEDNAWKTGTLSKVLGNGHFLVRIHGLAHEISVDELRIRVRQSWRHGQWFPIRKISGSHGDVKFSKMNKTNCHTKLGFQEALADARIHPQEYSFLPVYNVGGLQESHAVSSKTLKRASPVCSSLHEASHGKAKKVKGAKKEHRQRLVAVRALEKVDAFAYPHETPGNKRIQASFNNSNSLSGFYETEKGTSNGVGGCYLARISEPNDSDNDQCSVGSCSVSSDGPNKLSSHYVTTSILSGDAESCSTSRNKEGNCLSPPEKEAAASIHRLELHAYQSTLEALYASGPLSWEKEALLTNLRINLHISNDEHLTELRHLISPQPVVLVNLD